MEKEDRIYKAMLDRLVGLYERSQAIFDAKPLLKLHFTEVMVSRNAMQVAIQNQSGGSTKGSTEDVNGQKKLVSQLAYETVEKVRPYAKSKSQDLLKKVDFSVSDFYKVPHEEFPGNLHNFIGAVRAELAHLTDYEVTAAELDLIETSVATFEALNTGRDLKGNSREEATASIPRHRKQAMVAVSLLDDLVPAQLRKTEPELVMKYQEARNLVG